LLSSDRLSVSTHLSWSNQPLEERHCNASVELRRPLGRRKELSKLQTLSTAWFNVTIPFTTTKPLLPENLALLKAVLNLIYCNAI